MSHEVDPLIDSFGRTHRDLRISVTDRCNFRCTYCMPEDGLEWIDRSELLSFEEIERVAALMVERFGVDSIRLTGGEPTIRANIAVLVEKLAALDVDLAMTTNGTTLDRLAGDLRAAGLGRLNISLDSLRRDRFEELTRRDDLERVLAGVDAATAAGFDPVKINVVVMRGINDDEILDFARFGRDRSVEVRFIEFMPLDADGDWSESKVVTQREIVERITEALPLDEPRRGVDPATMFRYRDGGGVVGVIPSVSEPFCESCDRVRLSAEGALRSCLFAHDETDLRDSIRSGGSDDDVERLIRDTVASKWAGHAIGKVNFIRPSKSMSQIGG